MAQLYYTTDANHNVTAVTNAAGVVQERYSYTAYGQVTVYDASWSNPSQTSSVGNTRLIRRHGPRPADRRLLRQARWYNYTTGTFVNRDPIAADLNLYRYVLDNPANTVDPTGEAACVIVDSSLSVELDPKKPCSVKGKNNFYNPSYVRCSVACNFFVRMMNESIGYKIHQEFPIGPGAGSSCKPIVSFPYYPLLVPSITLPVPIGKLKDSPLVPPSCVCNIVISTVVTVSVGTCGNKK